MKGLARTREHAARENTFKQKNLPGNELTFYSIPFLGILDAIIKKRSYCPENYRSCLVLKSTVCFSNWRKERKQLGTINDLMWVIDGIVERESERFPPNNTVIPKNTYPIVVIFNFYSSTILNFEFGHRGLSKRELLRELLFHSLLDDSVGSIVSLIFRFSSDPRLFFPSFWFSRIYHCCVLSILTLFFYFDPWKQQRDS